MTCEFAGPITHGNVLLSSRSPSDWGEEQCALTSSSSWSRGSGQYDLLHQDGDPAHSIESVLHGLRREHGCYRRICLPV